jgi:hypothetical protein
MTRIIINGISFYTTWKRVCDGTVSDNISINTAIAACKNRMLHRYSSISTTVTVYDHKMDRVEYSIQINKG